MKKIILILLLVFSFFSLNNVYGSTSDEKTNEDYKEQVKEKKEEYDKECAESGKCLEKPNWTLKVGSFTANTFKNKGGIEDRADWLFSTIIKNLMIALGVLSVFIMTIGGGYMILHNGQDELLNKGKSIFMAGIYAMVTALISYTLMSIITNLIYG